MADLEENLRARDSADLKQALRKQSLTPEATELAQKILLERGEIPLPMVDPALPEKASLGSLYAGRLNRERFFGWIVVLASLTLLLTLVEVLRDFPSNLILGISLVLCGVMTVPVAKRFHDLNKSGWYSLLASVPLISLLVMAYLFFWKGTSGPNRFGPDRLEQDEELE
ncbi:MAG: DUF805 domain-containing protein [Betaproteobacteria bacterium]|nr:DUF805 domain-containing protein [Betaproteobacteria bacterium]